MVDGSLIFGTGIDNSGFASGVSNLQSQANVALGNIAADMISQISSAAAQIPQQVISVGSGFEASMSQVAATMGITSVAEEFEILSAAAKKMGETTKFSASQAGEALNYLALAGYDAEKAVSALPTVLNVAAAGGMELASASDMITDAMSALGLETAQMSTFADQLAVTAQKSNTSVSQLGEAILTVGGTAKTLSGGVVEMNTALGILADNGIKGSEGGTMLRNVILSLSAPTSTAAAALSELGVTAFDASGAMRPLQETFSDLDNALSKLSDQEKNAVLNEIFNKVDLKGVNALLGTSAERFDELSGYISDCTGAAEQMAETMSDNLQGDLTIMQSALEGLGVATYEKFQVPFRDAVQEVTVYIGDLTESMTDGELSESVGRISEGFSELAATAIEFVGNDAIPAVISGLELIVDHAEELKFILILVAAEFIAFKAAAILTPVVGGIMAASRAVTLFAAEMSFANLQQLALRGGMTASEIVVGLFTGKITAATAAQAAFNAVSAAVPFGVLLAGLAAVVAATISFSNYISNAADEINDMRIADSVDIIIEKTNSATEALRQNREEFENLIESQKEKSNADNAEINNIQRLWNELKNYVDESGNVIANNERANAIIDLLNNNYDMNIEYINGQIQGYSELAGSMDDYIEKLRLEARIRNNQPIYDDAIKNIDGLKAELSELEQQESDNMRYFKFSSENENFSAATGVFAEELNYIRQRKAEIESEISSYQQTIDDFEGLVTQKYKPSNDEYKSPAQLAAEEGAAQYVANTMATMEAVTNAQAENTEKLKAGWKQLEHEYTVGIIASEEELYAKKAALLKQYGDEYNSEHWRYYEELYEQQKDYEEKSQKAAQKAAEESKRAAEEAAKEAADIREQEWNEISHLADMGFITAEKAYERQLEWIQKYCPEYADEWYSYYKTITNYQREALKEQVNGVKDSLSKTVSEYKKAYAELESSVNSYKNRLLSVGDIFSITTETDENGNKTTTYSVENIKKQIAEMQKYHDYIKKIKGNGGSEALIAELTSMDFKDGMVFAENLANMSAEEVKEISDLIAEKEKTANDLSNELYASEKEQLNNALVDSIIAEFGTLPEDIREIGAKALESFIAGISESEDLSEKVSDFTDNFFTACDEGISNGIAGLNLTDSITAAFNEQDTYSIGKTKGDELVSGFNDALSDLYALFEAELAYTAAQTSAHIPQNSADGTSGTNKTERIVVENHNDVTVEMDGNVVGKKAYTYIKEHERRTGS